MTKFYSATIKHIDWFLVAFVMLSDSLSPEASNAIKQGDAQVSLRLGIAPAAFMGLVFFLLFQYLTQSTLTGRCCTVGLKQRFRPFPKADASTP